MKFLHAKLAGPVFALALILLSSRSTMAAEATDLTDLMVRDFRVSVLSLFDADRYVDLDTLAQQLQQERSRFAGGNWRLHVFFNALSSPGSETATDAAWQAHIVQLEQWAKASPLSATPRVALAQTYLRFAWKARGHGYADTVTPQGGALFQDRVQSARAVLDQCASLAQSSPHWYLIMQNVALAQQWSRDAFDALAENALAHEPGYFYFAISESNYLLPKWHGKPGDTEHYAAQVADRIGGAEGDAVYFRIAAAMNCCNRTQVPDLSWPRVQRGFAALESLYGSTNRQRNVMAYLALRRGDTATAQQLFARIDNDWNKSVWKAKAAFDAGRMAAAQTTDSVR